MRNRHREYFFCALRAAILVGAGVLSSPLSALPGLDNAPSLRPPTTDLRRNLDDVSPERAVAIAERRYNGRAVGARHMGNGVYRVRILQDDGKVRTVTVRPD